MLNPLRALTLGGLLLFSTLGRATLAVPNALRIGYQRGSVNMVLAKSYQLLGQRYPSTHIPWIEFPAGPQMLEALDVSSVGIGSTDDIPSIFAQATDAGLVYISSEPPKPKTEVILVTQGSPIHSVTELEGKKVAFQRGSSSHNLLLRVLRLAGLKFNDIQPVCLAPTDTRAVFQQGNVDAWATWDPYYSTALLQGGARILTDGTDPKQTGSFYLAFHPYAERNSAFTEGIPDTFTRTDTLTHSQRAQGIALLAKTMGLPEAVIASYLDHRPPTSVTPASTEAATRQQQTADLFYKNRLVPKRADTRARIWQPAAAQGVKS